MGDLAKFSENALDPERIKIIREKIAILDKAFSANLALAPYCHPRQGSLPVYEPVSGKMEHTEQFYESMLQDLTGPKKEPPEK